MCVCHPVPWRVFVCVCEGVQLINKGTNVRLGHILLRQPLVTVNTPNHKTMRHSDTPKVLNTHTHTGTLGSMLTESLKPFRSTESDSKNSLSVCAGSSSFPENDSLNACCCLLSSARELHDDLVISNLIPNEANVRLADVP